MASRQQQPASCYSSAGVVADESVFRYSRRSASASSFLAVCNRISQIVGFPVRSAISRYHAARFRNSSESGIPMHSSRYVFGNITSYRPQDIDQRVPPKSAGRDRPTRLPSPSTPHASTSKPAASSRVTWEGTPLRYSVIEVPHHPGSPRRNLSESKTYHVINLQRRPSSPNSGTTQSPYCSRCLSNLFGPFVTKITLVFGNCNTTRIIRFVGWVGDWLISGAPDAVRRLHAVRRRGV